MNTRAKEQTVASDVMTVDPVCVDTLADLEEIVGVLELQDVSGLPVVDGAGRLVGVVSKTDVLTSLVSREEPGRPWVRAIGRIRPLVDWTVTAESLIRDAPVTAQVADTVQTLARLMAQERVHRVVIVDGERRPVGMVTALDLVGYLAD